MANLVEILLKTRDEATKQLEGVSGKLRGIQSELKKTAAISGAAFAAITAATYKAVSMTAAFGDELHKTAIRTGASVEMLSTLGFAAEQSGASFQDVTKSMTKLAKAAVDAEGGLETYKSLFDELGVSVTDTDGKIKDIDQLFYESADALGKLESDTRRMAIAQELFGKGGVALIPMMKEGADGIRAMQEEARGLGMEFSQLEAEQAAAFTDALNRVKTAVRGVVMQIGKAFIPEVTAMADKIKETVVGIGEWISENRGFVVGAIKAAIAITGIVAALATLGLIVPMIVSGMALITLPVIAIIAAVAGLVAGVVYFRDEIKLALQVVGELWGRAYNAFMDAFAEPLSKAWDWLVDVVKGAMSGFIDLVVGAATLYWDYFVSPILKGVGKIYEGFRWVMDKLGVEMPELAVGASLFEGIAERAQAAWGLVADAIDTVREKNLALQEEAVEEKVEEKKDETGEGEIFGPALPEGFVVPEIEAVDERLEEIAALQEEYLIANEERRLEIEERLQELGIKNIGLLGTKRETSMSEWQTSIDRIGTTLKDNVMGQMEDIWEQGFRIRDAWEAVAQMIWDEVIRAINVAIVRAIILKILTLGMAEKGGIVPLPGGSEVSGFDRAQHGLVAGRHGILSQIASNQIFSRFSPDTIPILAAPGEAFLPVGLTNALKQVLGVSGSGRFQRGGTVAAGAGAGGITVIVQGNIYANDSREVDNLARKISDAVLDRNIQLHATTSEELR